jgi:ribosomal protein S13
MKFEQILKVYWSKGFYYNGVVFNFDTNLDFLINNCSGIGKPVKRLFIKRFEWYTIKRDRKLPLTTCKTSIPSVINKLFSKMNPFNHTIHELTRYHVIRLYLIRSFRGYAQALGKPSRGQRTWSNAWNAHYGNQLIKQFITLAKKLHAAQKRPEKIDYRRIKNYAAKTKRIHVFKKKKPKLNAWF